MVEEPGCLSNTKSVRTRNDALGRKEIEPPLTQLVTQALGSFVLALDGSWGSGKTTFLQMWQVRLKEKGHACLYLNAWKNDFAQEPLVAVVSELSRAIEDFAPKDQEGDALRQKMKKARKLAESIAKRAIPVAAKLVTFGALDTEGMVEKVISDLAADIAQDRIKEYENGKSEIEEFRKALVDLTDEVAKLNPEASAKVVVIIDELDRCRPTYAVQLLERIKHLFDVPGVVFVLGIDRTQLHHSIRALYGSGFDAFGYLRRFIDLDYRIPEPKTGNYCSFLFKRFGIEDLVLRRPSQERQSELENLQSFLGYLMSASRMSLREQEQTVARLRVVLQTIPKEQHLYEIALSILLFLREWDHSTYTAFFGGNMPIEEVLSKIENLPCTKEASNAYRDVADDYVIEAYLLAGADELALKSAHLERYQALYKSREIPADTDEKVARILELFIYIKPSLRRGGAGFKATQQRLALTNHFVP
jgi:hypothetical protein